METHRQRQYEAWAANLLSLSLPINLGVEAFSHKGFFTGMHSIDYLILASLIAFVYTFIYFIRRGLNAAKYLFLCFSVWAIRDTLFDTYAPEYCNTPLLAINCIAQPLLVVGASALILLSLGIAHHAKMKLLVGAMVISLGIVYFINHAGKKADKVVGTNLDD